MKFVIIGSGIAGISAAECLRKNDADSSVVMISDEEYYYRAALSKYLQGKIDSGEVMGKPGNWYESDRSELVKVRVEKIRAEENLLYITGGGKISYDRLLVCTGAAPVMLGWPGNDLDGVCTYRGRDCVERFMRHVGEGARRAVVIGGGILGIELVEDFRRLGLDVTLLIRGSGILDLLFDDIAAGIVLEQLKDDDVDIRFETEADAFVGENGKLTGVVTKEGETIPCGIAAVAIGIRPDGRILEGSGIAFDRAVLVDEFLRTNVQDVFAAGDCCAVKAKDGERYIPTRTWLTAALQGETAAKNMLGGEVTFEEGVFFNVSHVYNSFYGVLGDFNPRNRDRYDFTSWRFPDGGYMRWTVQGGRIVGAIIVDAMRYIWPVRQMIEYGLDVTGLAGGDIERMDLFLLLPQEKQVLF